MLGWVAHAQVVSIVCSSLGLFVHLSHFGEGMLIYFLGVSALQVGHGGEGEIV